MLSQEVIEALSEILVKRAEEVNTFTLKTIAQQLKKISKSQGMRPTEVNKLVAMLKYGGDYDKIKRQLAKMSKLNQRDIDKIFKKTAKKNQEFSKQFYKYRNIKFIPLEENQALLSQVEAIADLTKNTYKNIGNTRAIGFTKIIRKGKKQISKFVPLQEMYEEVIDRGIIAISQGRESFDSEFARIVKELSSSGLKYVSFESGYRRRLDSQVRMNLLDGIRQLTNEINLRVGEEFGSDGVEVDVQYCPAPDHAKVQGRQFSNEEFYKFQTDQDCVAYDFNKPNHKGLRFPAISEETGYDRRSISQYNCRHNVFPIVLGVSRPVWKDDKLQEIIDDSESIIEFDGKKYTKYEASQLQRRMETSIRKAKDQQIMARELGDDGLDIVKKSQDRVTNLTRKYRELTAISGLPSRMDRARVSGYRRISTKK